MTRDELIQMVNDEITVSGSLPYSIPQKEMERIIGQAENWFYVNYGPAVETTYYVLPRNLFAQKEWKASRSVLLPDCVISIQDVRDFTGGGILGTVDSDFADNRLIASELFLSPFQSDDLVLRTAQYSYWDLKPVWWRISSRCAAAMCSRPLAISTGAASTISTMTGW